MHRARPLILTLCFAAALGLHLLAAPMLAYHLLGIDRAMDRLKPQPVVRELRIPEAVRVGEPLEANWRLENIGRAAMHATGQHPEANWQTRLYLSRRPQVDGDARLLAEIPLGTSLAPRAFLDQQLTSLPVPDDWIGRVHLVVQVAGSDAATTLASTATKSFWIESDVRPAVTVTAIDAPGEALAGGSIPLRFTVSNLSEGVAWRSWEDVVVLSKDDVLSNEDVVLETLPRLAPLLPGESYEQTLDMITLPRGLQGRFYLLVIPDARHELARHFEGTGDDELAAIAMDRSYRAHPIDLLQLNVPDLQVLRIEIPQTIVVDDPAEIRFDVVNRGDGPTGMQPWLDGLYLSRSERVDETAMELLTMPSVAPLQPGQAYRSEPVTITVPSEWLDQDSDKPVYLIAAADVDNLIAEGPFGDNNTRAVQLDVLRERTQLEIGRENPPYEMTMAWIPFDDFEALQALRGEVLHPAVQMTADPQPDAPLEEMDPQPAPQAPSMTTQPATVQQAEAVDPSDLPVEDEPGRTQAAAEPQARAQQEARPPSGQPVLLPPLAGEEGIRAAEESPVTLLEPMPPMPDPQRGAAEQASDRSDSETREGIDVQSAGETLTPQPVPVPQTAEAVTPGELPGEDDLAATSEAQPAEPRPDAAAASEQPARPTAAPRRDREAPPVVRVNETVRVRPGAVLTSEGIEIRTVAPRPSVVAQSSTIPRNPQAVLTFNRHGEVVEVTMVRSTGAGNWDGPVVASLYQWRASGRRIEALGEGYLEIPVRLLLSATD